MHYREADDFNMHLFHEGTARNAYEYMGAHAVAVNGTDGYMFRVWAPRAQAVSVVGEFNSWAGNVYVANTEQIRYFEESPFHPDYLLGDIAEILHPTGSHPLRYFKKLK